MQNEDQDSPAVMNGFTAARTDAGMHVIYR